MFNRIHSTVITEEDYLNSDVLKVLDLQGSDLFYYTNPKCYSCVIEYKGHKMALLYGKFVNLRNPNDIKIFEDCLSGFGPDSVVKHKTAQVLKKLGLCLITTDSVKTTCGHKAELPVVLSHSNEILCPKCYLENNDNFIIGKNSHLLYVLPF